MRPLYIHSDHYANWSLRQGVKFGFVAACGLSIAAVFGALVAFLIAVTGPSSIASGPSVLPLLWVFPAYFLGAITGGFFLAAASHIPNRIVRCTIQAGLVGTCIYAAIGLVSGFIEGTPVDWHEIETISLILGGIWAFLGFLLGVHDTIRPGRRGLRLM